MRIPIASATDYEVSSTGVELLMSQIKAIEDERDEIILTHEAAGSAAMLMKLKGIGPEFALVLWSECLYRRFENRRQVAAYAGLAPTL